MLEVVIPTPSVTGCRASVVGRSRKRKPWEFTWDDAGGLAELSPVATQASEAIDRGLDRAGPVIVPPRAAPERRSRKRKAWEFTWDEQEDVGLSTGSPPAAARQESSLDASDAATDARETSAPSSPTSSPVVGTEAIDALDIAEAAAMEPSPSPRKPRRRRLAAREAVAEEAEAGSSPSVSPPSSGTSAPVAESPPLDSMDVERVRQQLFSLGQSAADGKPASIQEDVSWIRPRRSRHEVQVVHVRSGSKRSAQEAADVEDVDGALRTDPLIANALRVVSLLRSNHEDENVIALRRAVRELREQVAGLEAQAYAKSSRPEIPLFKQVYDPKTRTG